MIVDAHHHVWDPAARPHEWLAGLPSLHRPFTPADYAGAAAAAGVTASVLVQVLASSAETEDFLALAAGRMEPWAGLISELAGLPNVTCKLSGLVTEAGPSWQADDLVPYLDRMLEAFGPGRLMFGSDWPVCTLAAGYAEVVALTRALLEPRLSAAEQDAVLYATAVAAYQLKL